MPLGIDYFKFCEFLVFGEGNNKAKATVEFTFDDKLNDGANCAHFISIVVRVDLPSNPTIEQLHDASLKKAVDQLRHAISISENKSAKELILAAKQDTLQRQNEYQEKADKEMQESISSIGA